MRTTANLFGMLPLVFLVVIVGCTQNQTKPQKRSVNTAHTTTTVATQKFTSNRISDSQKLQESSVHKTLDNQNLTIPLLLKDYEENEIAADQHYKGRRLMFISLRPSVIQNIGRDLLGQPYIAFQSSQHDLHSVQAFFGSESSVAPLRVGDGITFIEGICDGMMLNVILKDCRITGDIIRWKQ